jgi:large subunit ribosomal protein L2
MSDKLRFHKPVTPTLRGRVSLARSIEMVNGGIRRAKKLKIMVKKAPGRSLGRVTVRHKGGGARKYYRVIDFRRNKFNVKARVVLIEYDPNRTVNVAMLNYSDGEKRYILCPEGLKIGDVIESSESAPIRVGNCLPLSKIPLGTAVHNVEINKGAGGAVVRSAGTYAQVLSKEEDGRYVQIKLPSGEVRRILSDCFATVGQLANMQYRNIKLGKAGRSRHLGIKPTVRGIAQDPHSHPHGGGEGRSGIGMSHPKTPWGKVALGGKTRRRSRTDRYILSRRTK